MCSPTTPASAHAAPAKDRLTKRNTYIDVLKGYAIAMVVLGHAIQRGAALGLFAAPHWLGAYWPFQGYVTMPLFFAISGFLARGRVRTPRWRWLADKARMLLVPWAAWTIVYYWLIHEPLWPNNMPFAKYLVTQATSPSLWYFLMLFEIYAVVALCLAVGRGEWALVALGAVLVPFSVSAALGLSVQYYLWFVLGWYASKYAEKLVQWRVFIWALSVPIYVAIIVWSPQIALWYTAAAALSSAGVASLIAWLVSRSALNRAAIVLGQRSLEVYAGQFLFTQFGLVHSWWNVALIETAAVAGPLLIGEVLRRNPVTHTLFLGARKVRGQTEQVLPEAA